MIDENIIEFLKESNNIESVYDDTSLAQAIYAWNYISNQNDLTENVILKTHKILSLHSNLYPNEKGYFRTVPIWIGTREGLSFKGIPFAIQKWIKSVKLSIKNPGSDGANILEDHVQFEKIHPFVDFNGRTGRILMNWQRIQAGLPILIIKANKRQEYYKLFI